MFEKFKVWWTNCINNSKTFITTYRNGDPLIVKKNMNTTVSMFKRSAPDKPWFNINVTGDPEMNILDLAILVGAVVSGLSIICLMSKALFKIRYHDRW